MSTRLLARFISALGLSACLGVAILSFAPPQAAVSAVHSRISVGADGRLTLQIGDGPAYIQRARPAGWTLAQLRGSPRGTEKGIALDFGKPAFAGTLAYGLIPYDDTRYPQPVFRTTTPIKEGKAEIDIKASLAGTYDMVGWAKSGRGVLGYRVITQEGGMLHDGRVAFRGAGPFEVDVTMLEGPFVANVTDRSVVVWFEMDRPAPCEVRVSLASTEARATPEKTEARARTANTEVRATPCREGEAHQEITIDRLRPGTDYRYTVRYGKDAKAELRATPKEVRATSGARDTRATGAEETYGFRTAPRPGARRPFTFGYASDSRGGVGGGERNFLGPNAHIMRRLMALAANRRVAFVQFTGDLVSGSGDTPDARLMELANWKRTIEPQAHWLPVYTGIGNHEAILTDFAEPGGRLIRLPRWPFATESTEAVFARALVNPENGPGSEDGATYDPDPASIDFPTYRENVYSYVHDNVAVVVLNSDYWYAPNQRAAPEAGGNLHGYLMDQQMAWLARQLDALERNAAIDHVFITPHTPVFPNGGHVGDTMWYGGKNEPRPWVAGKPVAKGIIERRDDLLRLVQSHPKVLALLTGDEHNYSRLPLGPGVTIYPADWTGPKVVLQRRFFQINNGAAGAPYYARQETPWGEHLKAFSTQNALCLFHVEGPRVRLEVVNPETLEVIDQTVLR